MAPSPAASARTFISYAREDSEFALKLAGDLRKAGANVWLDQLDIPVGADWTQAVEDGLNSCGQFLVILSPDSVGSREVLAELNSSLEEGKTILPVLFRECKRPFRIRTLQYADFTRDYRKGLGELLQAFGFESAPGPAVLLQDREAAPAEIPRPKPITEPGRRRWPLGIAALGGAAVLIFAGRALVSPLLFEPQIVSFTATQTPLGKRGAGVEVALSWNTRNAARIKLLRRDSRTSHMTTFSAKASDRVIFLVETETVYTLVASNWTGRSVSQEQRIELPKSPPAPARDSPPPAPRLQLVSSGQELLAGARGFNLETGQITGNFGEADIWWELVDDTTRSLRSFGQSAFCLTGKADLGEVSAEELLTSDYAIKKLNGSANAANEIPTGTVLLVKTHQGRYSKVRIEQYGVAAPGDLPQWPKSSLVIRWMTYEKQ